MKIIQTLMVTGIGVAIVWGIGMYTQRIQNNIVELRPTPKPRPTAAFVWALVGVETDYRPRVGECGGAGPLQITDICLEDINENILLQDRWMKLYEKQMLGLVGRTYFTLGDRHKWETSKLICQIYLTYWGAYFESMGIQLSYYDYMALWRIGPTNWTPKRTRRDQIDRDRIVKFDKYFKV